MTISYLYTYVHIFCAILVLDFAKRFLDLKRYMLEITGIKIESIQKYKTI